MDVPSIPRTKTAEQPQVGRKITIDLDDAEGLATFLLEISQLVRARRRLTITIE